MQKPRIIFMGTPLFAVTCLKKLVEHHHHIVAVITAPDKPQGRGRRIIYSPVKEYALQNNLLLLQPTRLKDSNFICELKKYHADIQIVAAFRMLPEVVWSMPSLGTFNLHASLLPQYRGAAPINWSIINGEKETGVTTFFINQNIDTGNIIMQEKEPIFDNDTAGTLHDRLMDKGADLVIRTVDVIASKTCASYPQPQTNQPIKTAPKIFSAQCEVDWHRNTEEIRNFVRGLNPHPTAWTMLNGKKIKLFVVTATCRTLPDSLPGTVHTDNKEYLCIKTGNGWIDIEELQSEGKKRMHINAFLRGNKIITTSP